MGEATPCLRSLTAPARIRKHVPRARLIAVLRRPAERAFSSCCHVIRDGFESPTFEEGPEEEERRRAAGWSPLFPRALRSFIQGQLRKHSAGPKPRLNPETRRALTGRFREDILLLQGLLGRDLSMRLRDPERASPAQERPAESSPPARARVWIRRATSG